MHVPRGKGASPSASLTLASMCAADFLHGVCEVEVGSDGWARPHRFSAAQRRVLASCLSWHPGIYRQMATTTAGVCVRFFTDATEAALAVRLDGFPPASAAETRAIRAAEASGEDEAYDGMSAVVDGRPLGTMLPRDGVVRFTLSDPATDPGNGIVALPGLGERHEVCLWLPCLRGCEIRELWTDGTYVEAVPALPRLLVVGDEPAQGFGAADPATTWPALLASARRWDLLNQSVGGMVFQPSLLENAPTEDVAQVMVALGDNYAHERCEVAPVHADVHGFFALLRRRWPQALVCAVVPETPGTSGPDLAQSPRRGSCFAQVPALVRGTARSFGGVPLAARDVFGARLLADVVRQGFLGEAGHAQVARRLEVLLAGAVASPQELCTRAQDLLAAAPACALPLREALRRGLGQVLYANEGCVLARLDNGDQLLFASDASAARRVCEVLVRPSFVNAMGAGTAKVASDALGLGRRESYHICAYEGSSPIAVDPKLASAIRALDETFTDVVLAQYRHARFLQRERLREALSAGRFLGAFVDDELVGFVGEHAVGSIGMLEVFGGHRREGWGEALEAAKINEHLLEGHVPWLEVYPRSRASLRLQKKLGLVVLPAAQACYVSPGAQEEPIAEEGADHGR